MKTHSSIYPVRPPRTSQAFTLVEIQISMAIIMLVIGGVISSHVFGLKLNEATRAKLSASDSARNSLNKIVNDVRSAKTIQVGSGNLNAFSPVADGSLQKGSALRIYPTTNTNSFVVYYLDTSDSKLKKASTSATNPVAIAEYLTNTVLFTSESYNGTVLTDNQNNRVIGVDMQFYQIRYPITTIGAGGYFDYYQVKTKITRRALE
jgi:Tfp pilus assembly protein PilW